MALPSPWVPPPVTQAEFNTFHAMDRSLYSIFVIELVRDPVQSMQMLALFLSLEKMGFRSLVQKILSFPLNLINELADETAMCLNCIKATHGSVLSSFEGVEIVILQSLMNTEISLRFFYENRERVLEGVKKMIKEVCIRACRDIMEYALRRNAGQLLPEMPVITQPSTSSTSNAPFRPGRPSPAGCGGSQIDHHQNPFPDDRTMFITFSRGYPVHEWELRNYFTKQFGKSCIEFLQIQEATPGEQSLYAVIVFREQVTVELILNGVSKAHFVINGKQLKARRYITRKHSN